MSNQQYNPFNDQELQADLGQQSTEYNPFNNVIEPVQTLASKPWLERLIGVGILGLFYLVQTVAGVLFVILLRFNDQLDQITSLDTAGPALKNMFAGMAIAEGLLIIALILFYNKKIWIKVKQAMRPFFTFCVKMVGYYALLWSATIIFSIIDSTLFPQYMSQAGDNQEVIEAALLTPSLPMIISICLTAPIVEEFVFRYGIIKKLLYGMNKYVAATVAAIIFSFAHIGFSQMTDLNLFAHLMLSYIGQALVFGFIYVREDNLLYSIAIHIINNLQAVILIILLASVA